MDYQGLADEAAGETVSRDIPDIASEAARGVTARELGSIEDTVGALIQEIEACQKILAMADAQDEA